MNTHVPVRLRSAAESIACTWDLWDVPPTAENPVAVHLPPLSQGFRRIMAIDRSLHLAEIQPLREQDQMA